MSQGSNLHNCLTDDHGRNVCRSIIALGSNIASDRGGSVALVEQAFDALEAAGLRSVAQSRLWRTPCVPVGAGPDYVNAVAVVETDLSPQAVLKILHGIEAAFDRARTGRWAARTLDLDLIDHGAAILPDAATQARWRALPPDRQPIDTPDQLILPHPRLQDRAFVLIPMAEAAPDWHDPITATSVQDLIAALPQGAADGMSALQTSGPEAGKTALSSVST